MSQTKPNVSIENEVKRIAFWGALVFAGLIVAIFVIQSSFERSIVKLSGRVVPMQRELGRLNDSVSSMFLEQKNVRARTTDELRALEQETKSKLRVEASAETLAYYLTDNAITTHPAFPKEAADQLAQSLERFSECRSELFACAKTSQTFRRDYEIAQISVGMDLSELLAQSSAISGKTRLQYVVKLRELAAGLGSGELEEKSVQDLIFGESRIATEAIDSFNLAARQLNTLANRVAETRDTDELNSLVANELIQNTEQLRKCLKRIDRLVSEQQHEADMNRLQELTERLVGHLDGSKGTSSLPQLRRRILGQETEMDRLEREAQSSADALRTSTETLMGFSEEFASEVSQDAGTSIRQGRAAALIVSFAGILLMIAGGFRVRTSVLALRTQNHALTDLSERLSQMNEGLEHSVAERTASMQLVLDSTGDGIFTVDLDGRILSERSRAVESWLGRPDGDIRIWDYLSSDDSAMASDIRLAFDQIADDILPFSVAAAQAPQRLQMHGRTYDLHYREIRQGGKLSRVLIIVRDVSAEVEAERAAQAVADLQKILGNLFTDRGWFCDSMREIEQLLGDIRGCTDILVARRLIHTLKGNSAVLGFRVFAEHLNRLESEMEVNSELPTLDQIRNLDRWWSEELAKLGAFFEFCDNDLIQIRKIELDRLIERIEEGARHSELLKLARLWTLQPLSVPLNRLARQAERLSSQLHKELDVQIDDGGLSMPEDRLAEFWPTMIHLMRNAVDHGLETATERRAAGKSERGLLRLQASVSNGWLEVRICDDGRGVDWETIRAKATAKGLAANTSDELIDALFSDGFSTKEAVNELSGRGVGLAAVRHSAERFGGGISVVSEVGAGTTFIIRFPWGQGIFGNEFTSRSRDEVPS